MRHDQQPRRNVAQSVLAVLLPLLCAADQTATADLTAQLAVERNDVFVGDVFTVTVLVEGASQIPIIDLSPLTHFRLSGPVGGGPDRGERADRFVFVYHCLATESGEWSLGPLRVSSGHTSALTPHVTVTVRTPQPSPASQIAMSLSKSDCVVGEPVLLTVTWSIHLPLQTVKAVDVQLPVLQAPEITVVDPYEPDRAAQKSTVGLPVGHTRVLAQRSTVEQNGQKLNRLTFQKILVVRQARDWTIPGATVLCTTLQGDGRSHRLWNQYPSYFDNDFFEQDFEGERQRLVASCDDLTLHINDLPSEGRPLAFSNLIGSYRLQVTARPTEVIVGAPVTLTLRVSGTGRLECVDLPPLSQQPNLSAEFRVASARAPGIIQDEAIVFTQTIRPRSAAIREIPAIELSWYDPAAKQYGVARSKPIPITVIPGQPLQVFGTKEDGRFALRNILETSQQGLRHNYEGKDVLIDRSTGTNGWHPLLGWSFALLAPPAVFLVLAISRSTRRRHADESSALRARHAYVVFTKAMNRLRQRNEVAVSPQQLVELEKIVRNYLAQRLSLSAGALTFLDVQTRLQEHGVDSDTLADLQNLFERCQAHRFAGRNAAPDDWPRTFELARRTIREIESCFP